MVTEISNPPTNFKTVPTIKHHFESLRRDAVLWKAELLWRGAIDADEQAKAMEGLVEMLVSIPNEIKRTASCRQVADFINNSVKNNKAKIDKLGKELSENLKVVNKLKAKTSLTKSDQELLFAKEQACQQIEDKIATSKLQMMVPLSEATIKKQVAEALKQQKQKAETKAAQAAFEKEIQSAEDAGLPGDFKGNKEDVFAALKYGIYEHDKVYYSKGGNGSDRPISNFTMKIIYHVNSSGDSAFRLISMKNANGFECMININTDDFVSLGGFRKAIARQGDYIFKGGEADLFRLQEFLQKDEASVKRIEILGWNSRGRFWAWSNGLTVLNDEDSVEFIPVDKNGIVEVDQKRYFIPACSMIYAEKDEMFVNEKKFVYTSPLSNFDFNHWAELMVATYKQKSIPAILFYIGSLSRDIIMSKVKRYPILNLFGPPGAGKGEMYESLMFMFGYKQDQIALGGATTPVGFMRKFAQFKNAIVGLDEYKNGLPTKVIESLKNLYDGIGYERGKMSNDFATESTPISSSTILAGQDMPTQEPALFMRCIMLSFEEGKFSDEQRTSFRKLKNEYERHGLSYITSGLLQFRNIFEKEFSEKYNDIYRQTFKDVANVEIEDRMIMNISILLTVMHLTEKKIQFPFSYQEAKSYLIDNMKQQHAILAGNSDVAKFWNIVESLFYNGDIREGREFMLQDKSLFLHLPSAHSKYQKECIARREISLSKDTLELYLQLNKSVYKGKFKKQLTFGPYSGCLQFDYSRLGINLIRVDRGQFTSNEAHAAEVKSRYEEMGMEYETAATNPGSDDELPFPINN